MAHYITAYETLYNDDDYQVKFFDSGENRIIVTFTVANGRVVDDKIGFGAGVFEPLGYSMLCFISKWDHWWQPDGIETAIDISRGIITRRSYADISTYGISMGAYAAGRLSGRLNSNRSILIAPQFTIDSSKPPFERRWSEERKLITFARDEMEKDISPTARKWIVHDPFHGPDRRHAALFLALPGAISVPIPFGGHSPADLLVQIRLLKPMVLAMLNDSFQAATFRRTLRDRRRLSPLYWNMIADKTWKRSPELALEAVERAIELGPRNASHRSRKMGILLRTKQYAEAAHYARKLVIEFPRQDSLWKGLSQACLKLGLSDEAIAAAQQAVKLRPSRIDMHMILLQSLMLAGQTSEAKAHGATLHGLFNLDDNQNEAVRKILK